MSFTPFSPLTVLPASALNAAFQAVDADAATAAAAAAHAETEAQAAIAGAAAAKAEADSAIAALASASGAVRTVNGVGPDSAGNIVVATGGSATLIRPAFNLLTDFISPNPASSWTDDGTSYVVAATPVVTYGSANAVAVYAGKTPSAYNAGSRTITAEILSSFPDADGVKVGLALHDPATGTLYVVAIGSDFVSIPGSASSYYRPVGALVQQVTGLSTGSGSKPQGTRSAAPVFSLQHCGRLWLRLVDVQNDGVYGWFSRDGTQWTPLPYGLSYASAGVAPVTPTWGVYADVGINQVGDWYGALYNPTVFAARILSFVES